MYIKNKKLKSCGTFSKDECITCSQVFVHGDSLKSCVVAVIVPHQAELTEWAVRRGVQADSFTGLCASRQVSRLPAAHLSLN